MTAPAVAALVGQDRLTALTAVAQREHLLIGTALGAVLDHAMRAGDALIAARELVPPGKWEAHVREHTDIGERSARAYIQVAKERPALERQRAAGPLSLRAALAYLSDSEADGDGSKGRRQPTRKSPDGERARNHRREKLGAATLRQLGGTSLTSARELDALVRLNRGAPPGELTPIVKQLVAAATAGEHVSAVTFSKNGGREGGSDRNDIGSISASELARKDARIDELQAEKRRLEIKIVGLESELAKLRGQLQATDHLSTAQLIDALERVLERDGINASAQLRKIRNCSSKRGRRSSSKPRP